MVVQEHKNGMRHHADANVQFQQCQQVEIAVKERDSMNKLAHANVQLQCQLTAVKAVKDGSQTHVNVDVQ
jgi:hypothetical protein